MAGHLFTPKEFFYDNSFDDYQIIPNDDELDLFSIRVNARTCIGNTTWDPGVARDLHNVYGIDAVAVLESILVEQITADVRNTDREIIEATFRIKPQRDIAWIENQINIDPNNNPVL